MDAMIDEIMEAAIAIVELVMKIVGIVVVAGLLVAGCSYVNKKLNQKDDWFGEELVEQVIQDKIGIDIDLTPGSKEPN